MDIKERLILILSGIFFTCTLSVGIVFILIFFKKKTTYLQSIYEIELKNKELEMMNAVVQAQETERTNIARNLHDEVGAILAMAQRNLSVSLDKMTGDDVLRDDIEFTLDVLDQSVDKIRAISHGMLPHFLVKFGLLKALQRLMEQTEKSLGNSCSFNSSVSEDLSLEQRQEIHFYCIATELINNLMKHARPQFINLKLDARENHLILHIQHDGVAISQADYEYLLHHGNGMGLESISHRLRIITGELQYQRQTKGGTIEISMPLKMKIAPNNHEEISIPLT
ncbi:MAG: sensor histidine kinase [Flavobacteriales bacterium]